MTERDDSLHVVFGATGAIGSALRETITRRPVTMPVAGKPGDFAVIPAPEALPGFQHVTASRP